MEQNSTPKPTSGALYAPLPDQVEKYSQTPDFTPETAPAKLTQTHDTKPGVWGVLRILEGGLDFFVCGEPEERRSLAAGDTQTIAPQQPHRIAYTGPALFRIEFHR